jgi:hypothetical protein
MRPLLLAIAVALCITTASTTYHAQSRPLVVTRLFTGPDGMTHTEEVNLPFGGGGNPPIAPSVGSVDSTTSTPVTEAQFLRTSPNYVADWHPVRRRQYVIVLAGQREIEVSDGKRVLLGPGSILLAEDTTGKGHITRGFGKEDAVSVVIAVADNR